MSKFVIPLNDLEYQDLSLAGGKAAHLRLLTLQGFAIPESVIITCRAFDQFVLGNREISRLLEKLKKCWKIEGYPILGKIIDQIHQIEFTEDFQNTLLNFLPIIHFPHFNNAAVRSSIVLKEIPTFNLPSLHRSVLNVSTFSELLDAVRNVWASHWSRKSYDFRVDNCIPHEQTSMAVLLQRMCKTDYSGLLFTSHKGDRNQIKVVAGWGLPQGTVPGKVPTDEVILVKNPRNDPEKPFIISSESIGEKEQMLVYKSGEEKIVQTAPGMNSARIVKDREANLLGTMATRVEGIFNRPMIITWGHDREMLMLDAIYNEQNVESSSIIWMHTIFSALTGELPSPLTNSLVANLISSEMKWLSSRLKKGSPDNICSATNQVLGRLYINLDLVTSLFEKLQIHPDTTARYLEGFSIFQKDASGETTSSRFKPGTFEVIGINKWMNKVLNTVQTNNIKIDAFIEDLKDLKYSQSTRVVLGQTLERIIKNQEMLTGQMTIISSLILNLSMLQKIHPDEEPGELYRRIPHQVTTFDTQYLDGMLKLCHRASENRQVKEALSRENIDMGDLDSLMDTPFADEIKKFIQEFYYMSPFPLEISLPRINEDPTLILKTIRHLLRQDLSVNFHYAGAQADSSREGDETPAQGENLLKKMIPIIGWNSESIIKNLQGLILEGRKQRALLLELFCLIRKVIQALGADFERTKMIRQADDIFMLELDEVLSGAMCSFESFTKIIERRRENYKIWCDYFTPDVYSGTRLKIKPVNFTPSLGANQDQGIPVFPGKIQGRVLKVAQVEDFSRMEPDHIPVVERLSPVLAPFFLNVPGLIIEENGPHPIDIILVHKIRKPCVSGFPGLRRLVPDNTRVEIDGERGTIALLDSN